MSFIQLQKSCIECQRRVCSIEPAEESGSTQEVVDLTTLLTSLPLHLGKTAGADLKQGLEPVAENSDYIATRGGYGADIMPASSKWGAEAVYVNYEDGTIYIGQTQGEKRHGQGMWKGKACQYEGQWLNDQQHGRGLMSWTDGRTYDGQFRQQRFDGHGRMVWQTAKGVQTYEGQYKDDQKHGSGKFVWADGRIYDGQWSRGLRHGKGVYINSKGDKKIGVWTNDKFTDKLRKNSDSPSSETKSNRSEGKSEASSQALAPHNEHIAIPRRRL